MKSRWPQRYNATKETELNARRLRNGATEAEKLFWKILRRYDTLGYKFRRQHPIDHFIVDFFCDKAKLVIELDGDVHEVEHVKKHDTVREAILRKLGFTILRFNNELVFSNPDVILAQITDYLKQVKQQS